MPIASPRYEFNAVMVSGAPPDPGVFALRERDELICYGRALGGGATIQSRLRDHLAGADPCTARATHYGWEIVGRRRRRQAMSDIERDMRGELYRSLVPLGAEPMLLASAASWANGARDEEVLADLRNWNEAKLLEMKEWLPTMTGREFEALQDQIRQYEEARAALRQAA